VARKIPAAVIGGFATFAFYYRPIVRAIRESGVDASTVSAGPLSLNIWPLSMAESYIMRSIQQAYGHPVQIVGHSLGGLQGMYLMCKYPTIVSKVIAIGSPVYGIRWKAYASGIYAALSIDDSFVDQFRQDVQLMANRIVSIASTDDEICDTASCHIEGAKNYIISGPGHALLPFDREVVRIVLSELIR
jgi:pimeloyl-ACP methyl ester carboxylesterase